MTKYLILILLIELTFGKDETGELIIIKHSYNVSYIFTKNDNSIHLKRSFNLFLINKQLNININKLNDQITNISIDLCYRNNRHHEIERYNKMMVYPITNTPECIFSFYSSLDYGR